MARRGRHLAPKLRHLSRKWVMPLSLVMLLVWTTVAWADDISNDIDTTIDAAAESVSVSVGSSVGVGLYVQPRNNDGKPGCNLTGSTTLVVSVSSSDTSVATASPSSITFGSCGDTPTITVTGVSGGSATVSLSQVSNDTGGTFDLAPATFVVNVTAPPPSDTTPPLIAASVTGALGSSGWYVGDVTVSWMVVDNESAITSTSGCGTTVIDSDTTGTTLTCTATSGGGTASESVTIKRDATPPTISGSASPAANAAGWNNTDVTVSFNCSDSTSGIASCGPNQTLSTEGTGLEVTGTAVDDAGNSASDTVSGIKIDKTPPEVTWSNGPEDGANYHFGFVPAEPTCSAIDTLSGVDSGDCTVSGYGTTVGVHTMEASASDVAGNVASNMRSYTVLAWTLSGFYRPVEMSPDVYNTVKGGSTVPLKFEVFAGPTELTDTSAIKSFQSQRIACDNSTHEDPVELTTSGGTSLRYDTTEGQFVQNWQTPKGAGYCYKVTLKTQDDSSLVAYFKTK